MNPYKVCPTENPIEFDEKRANMRLYVTVFAYWEGCTELIGSPVTYTGRHAFWFAGRGHTHEVITEAGETIWLSGQCLTEKEPIK